MIIHIVCSLNFKYYPLKNTIRFFSSSLPFDRKKLYAPFRVLTYSCTYTYVRACVSARVSPKKFRDLMNYKKKGKKLFDSTKGDNNNSKKKSKIKGN